MTSSSLWRSTSAVSRRRSAAFLRSLYFPMPAASSNIDRRSSARSERMASIMRFSMTEYALAPSPVSLQRSTTSRSLQEARFRW